MKIKWILPGLVILGICCGNFAAADLNTFLDEKTIAWKPSQYQPMDFAAYHVFASDDMFEKTNEDMDMKILEVLEETNCDIIVLYIRPESYDEYQTRYDTLINKIRADNKQLYIGARFDEVAMSLGGYYQKLTTYTHDIIATIKPDYYGIVIEPETMETRHGFSATDEEWVSIIDPVAQLSKQLSPSTKTNVGGHKEELGFLQLAADIAEIDIIGFNIYGTDGIYDEYSGYLGLGDVVGNTIAAVKAKGKETWILETWAFFDPDLAMDEQIDAKWIRVLTYYAQKHSMQAIVPFFTGKFVYYGSNSVEFLTALQNGQRTASFYGYQSVIQEVRENLPTPTATPVEPTPGNSFSAPNIGEVKISSSGGQGVIYADKNEQAIISFTPDKAGVIKVKICTLNGLAVKEISLNSSGPNAAGNSIIWNCENARGEKVSSGIYIVYVKGPGIQARKKLAVLR
jgi:hypothetical protein